MPLPWKRSKSGRISRFVSDLQQSPKPGGSLVVETGFPTSLIDLFVKNRDRIKKSSSKKAQTPNHSHSSRRLPPLPPTASVTDDPSLNKFDEGFFDGVTSEYRRNGDVNDGRSRCRRGGGECVLMVVVLKVFVVVVLALSTKKLAVGITLSAFVLLFLELAVARVFNLCPGTQIRLDSLIKKLIGKQRQEMREEPSATQDIRNKFSFEIFEESSEESQVPQSEKNKLNREDSSATLDKVKPEDEDKQVQTIRDVVFKIEKSKSSKLKSKIVKKIVPKKLRSYKKKKMIKEKEVKEEEAIEVEDEEEEEEESASEVSSLLSEESTERDDVSSNPPLLESCEEEEEVGSKRDLTKAIAMIAIALAGLMSGKVVAIGLILCCCLILRVFCCKSQSRL